MAESIISTLIREQRHIFGVCPHCKELFRLVDVGVSYKSSYQPDWLDRLEDKRTKLDDTLDDLKDKEADLRRKAIERAKRTELPKKLKRIVPALVDLGINPEDVKTLFHPVDFVVFDGLNRKEVNRIVLLDHSERQIDSNKLHTEILRALSSGNLVWKTLRISESGDTSIS